MPYAKETTTTAKSEYSYFWVTCQLNLFPRILDVKPKLAHGRHPYGWTALHVAVMNRKPAIVDLILSGSIAALNKRNSWDGSNKHRASFAPNGLAHRAVRGSTALHYACLLGDMETVKVLLRHGAQWTIPDNIGLLPEHYIDVSHGVDKKHEFKCLCEEDELRRAKELEEQSKKLAEEETLKQSKKREQEDQLRRTKELEEKESKRRMRQSKCPTTHHRHRQLCLHFIFYSRRRDRECDWRQDHRTEGSDSVCRVRHPFAREWLGGSRPSSCHALPWQLWYRGNGTCEAGCLFPS
jgi:Ankyrin repeats (3 copies)